MKKVMKDFSKSLERERERERGARSFTKFVLVFGFIFLFSFGSAYTYTDGDGSSVSPYQINSIEDLDGMRENLSAHYVLGVNIDASITSTWNSGAGFIPIGCTNNTNSFTGSLNGNNFIISNLYVNKSGDYAGLFGRTYKAEIKDVNLENGNVTGTRNVGGLVGSLISSTITNCYSTGSVEGKSDVGGLVGSSSLSSISNSYARGGVNIFVENELNVWVGGLVGSIDSSSNITDSYSKENLFILADETFNGDIRAGGLVGNSFESSISNSYSRGRVLVSAEDDVTVFMGGLVGSSSSGLIVNSYYDNQTSGQSIGVGVDDASQDGVTGLTTEEMKTRGNYIGWDFDDIWIIKPSLNNGYPYLVQNKAYLGDDYIEINLTEGWNLFSISRNSSLNKEDRNITLKKGFNLVGYSGNESLNFNNVKINGTTWDDAVSKEIVSKYLLDFKNGFYTPLIPSVIQKSLGYIIYSFFDDINMTIENTFGNDELEYRLKNIRVKNRADGEIYFLEKKKDWFYPIEDKIVYRYNRTVNGEESYVKIDFNETLNSWESYWIRARDEKLSLIIYG